MRGRPVKTLGLVILFAPRQMFVPEGVALQQPPPEDQAGQWLREPDFPVAKEETVIPELMMVVAEVVAQLALMVQEKMAVPEVF